MFKCLFVSFLLVPTTEQYQEAFRYPDCAAVGNGFTDVGGSCYKILEVNGDLGVARDRCQAEHPNATVATIRCDQENQGVYNLAKSSGIANKCKANYAAGNYKYYWVAQMRIGLVNHDSVSLVFWENGAQNSYRNWDAGEPNNFHGNEMETVMYILDLNEANASFWNDMDGSEPVCAAACEVLTAKSGSSCGLAPCPVGTPPFTTTTPTCMHYRYFHCDKVGNGFAELEFPGSISSCYKVIEVHANFNDARALCKAQHPDADLATIRCEWENQAIYNLTRGDLLLACESYYIHNQHAPNSYYESQMWIGLRDPNSGTNGSWVNGDSASYRIWSDPAGLSVQSGKAAYMNLFEMHHAQWDLIDPNTVMCAAVCEVPTQMTGFLCALRRSQTGSKSS